MFRVLGAAIGAAVIAAVSFYIGGAVGFVHGQADQIGSSAAFEAQWITLALTALRAGRSEKAIELLEGQLDGEILSHGVYLMSPASPFLLPRFRSPCCFKILRPVAKYRAEHPSTAGEPGVAATLAGIDGCLQTEQLDRPDEQVREHLRTCYRAAWSRGR